MNYELDLFGAPPPPPPSPEDQRLEADTLEILTDKPASNVVVAARLGVELQTARRIVRRLLERNLVEDSGERERNTEYPNAVLWRARL